MTESHIEIQKDIDDVKQGKLGANGNKSPQKGQYSLAGNAQT
jgi:hypothetical protein